MLPGTLCTSNQTNIEICQSKWMRSSRAVRASDCQCRSRNSPGFDPRSPNLRAAHPVKKFKTRVKNIFVSVSRKRSTPYTVMIKVIWVDKSWLPLAIFKQILCLLSGKSLKWTPGKIKLGSREIRIPIWATWLRNTIYPKLYDVPGTMQ